MKQTSDLTLLALGQNLGNLVIIENKLDDSREKM